jgi:hypothetical protein
VEGDLAGRYRAELVRGNVRGARSPIRHRAARVRVRHVVARSESGLESGYRRRGDPDWVCHETDSREGAERIEIAKGVRWNRRTSSADGLMGHS